MAIAKVPIRLLLRDISSDMVAAWNDPQAFGADKYKKCVQISCGDIFEGAPAADAIVSPANSFGFMDGGIDMVYTNYFRWQMMERLQDLLRSNYDGELPVGCAVILPAYPSSQDMSKLNLSEDCNEGRPIRYLISAPTMRIPTNVSHSANAYLALRAVLREVCHHNESTPDEPITSVLCPGLGTAVGRMPYLRCAVQMRTAFDAVISKDIEAINRPTSLSQCCSSHVKLLQAGDDSTTRFSSRAEPGELFVPSCNTL